MQRKRASWAVLAVVAAIGWLAIPGGVAADGFVVRSAESHLIDKVYHLNARVNYLLRDTAVEAVQSGVPLTIRMEIQILRERSFWPDATVFTLEQRYQVQYHALTQQYLVRNLNSGAVDNYPTVDAALAALGVVESLPLLDLNLLDGESRYWGRVRVSLDIESLPAPLRPLAYLSSRWRLTSAWYAWSLQQ